MKEKRIIYPLLALGGIGFVVVSTLQLWIGRMDGRPDSIEDFPAILSMAVGLGIALFGISMFFADGE